MAAAHTVAVPRRRPRVRVAVAAARVRSLPRSGRGPGRTGRGLGHTGPGRARTGRGRAHTGRADSGPGVGTVAVAVRQVAPRRQLVGGAPRLRPAQRRRRRLAAVAPCAVWLFAVRVAPVRVPSIGRRVGVALAPRVAPRQRVDARRELVAFPSHVPDLVVTGRERRPLRRRDGLAVLAARRRRGSRCCFRRRAGRRRRSHARQHAHARQQRGRRRREGRRPQRRRKVSLLEAVRRVYSTFSSDPLQLRDDRACRSASFDRGFRADGIGEE